MIFLRITIEPVKMKYFLLALLPPPPLIKALKVTLMIRLT